MFVDPIRAFLRNLVKQNPFKGLVGKFARAKTMARRKNTLCISKTRARPLGNRPFSKLHLVTKIAIFGVFFEKFFDQSEFRKSLCVYMNKCIGVCQKLW